MTGYALHPEDRFDLDEIWEYIRSGNGNAANRVVSEIYSLSGVWCLFPKPAPAHGPDQPPLRFIRVYDYLIASAPDEKPLWVIAVMHGHRSPRVMAAILRGRDDRP